MDNKITSTSLAGTTGLHTALALCIGIFIYSLFAGEGGSGVLILAMHASRKINWYDNAVIESAII